MILSPLVAEADVVGGRVWLSWSVELDADAGERITDVPRLRLRRKELDFQFAAPGPGGDTRLVFDSEPAFAAGLGDVREFEVAPGLLPTARTRRTVTTVAGGDPPVELLRMERTLELDETGRLVRADDRVLDVDRSADGLKAGRPCYYELTSDDPVPGGATIRHRAIASPTARHASAKWLYDSLPSALTRHDVVTGPPPDISEGMVPEVRRDVGQLRRFVDLFGCATDHLRSRADGLRALHDIDTVDARRLPNLADWIAWDLAVDRSIPEQRHEVRHAARLYRITGTIPGCKLWARRLTDWDTDVKEFWPNVFLTNDTGNPDDPDDRGSRTVDTANSTLVASMGGPDDDGDYTYDTAPGSRYAFDAVGFFVEPTTETAIDVLRRRARLVENAHLFLPVNMRPVVVLRGEPDEEELVIPVAVTDSEEVTP